MSLSTISAAANAAVFAEAVETFAGVDEVHFYAAGLLEFPTELDRVFKITDGIMRSIIVAVEE